MKLNKAEAGGSVLGGSVVAYLATDSLFKKVEDLDFINSELQHIPSNTPFEQEWYRVALLRDHDETLAQIIGLGMIDLVAVGLIVFGLFGLMKK